MGVKEIRTVVKCDFSKPVAEQDGFHVRGLYNSTHRCHQKLTVFVQIEQMASRQ